MHTGNNIWSEKFIFTHTHAYVDTCDNSERKRGHDGESVITQYLLEVKY